jgi:hypothetical protein
MRFGAALLALLLASCASSSEVKSNKLASYTGQVKRLFVDADLGNALGKKQDGDQTEVFTSTLTNTLNSCGTQTEIHVKDPLDLTNNAGSLIKQFNPDSILQLTWKSARSGGNMAPETVYVLSLFDIASKKVVWKAEVDFESRWSAGTVFAGSIIGRMKQDGLISASCPVPAAK